MDLIIRLAEEVQNNWYGVDAVEIGWLENDELRKSVNSFTSPRFHSAT